MIFFIIDQCNECATDKDNGDAKFKCCKWNASFMKKIYLIACNMDRLFKKIVNTLFSTCPSRKFC